MKIFYWVMHFNRIWTKYGIIFKFALILLLAFIVTLIINLKVG